MAYRIEMFSCEGGWSKSSTYSDGSLGTWAKVMARERSGDSLNSQYRLIRDEVLVCTRSGDKNLPHVWNWDALNAEEMTMALEGTDVTEKTKLDGYIIWSPESALPPKVIYGDRPKAIKVAHRMAAQHKGQRFAVCKLVGVAQAQDVHYEDLEGK